MKSLFPFIVLGIISLVSCQNEGPQAITFGKDQCDNCKMTISDAKYGAELITEKGRIYKFDDQSCMKSYQTDNIDKVANAKLYVSDFNTEKLIPVETATFIEGGEVSSPMSGNKAAFANKAKAEESAKKLNAKLSSY